MHRLIMRDRKKGFKNNWKIADFREWFKQPHICYYCKQPLTIPPDGKHHQLSDLTIDRMDNNKGYSKGNIVLCCLKCNVIKGSWFTEQQMLEIAKQYFRD